MIIKIDTTKLAEVIKEELKEFFAAGDFESYGSVHDYIFDRVSEYAPELAEKEEWSTEEDEALFNASSKIFSHLMNKFETICETYMIPQEYLE